MEVIMPKNKIYFKDLKIGDKFIVFETADETGESALVMMVSFFEDI
mgnify:CR=1 FL=1